MRKDKSTTSTMLYDVFCDACGWHIIHACCNDNFCDGLQGKECFDWWYYCSNKGCKNHIGEDGHDLPSWCRPLISFDIHENLRVCMNMLEPIISDRGRDDWGKEYVVVSDKFMNGCKSDVRFYTNDLLKIYKCKDGVGEYNDKKITYRLDDENLWRIEINGSPLWGYNKSLCFSFAQMFVGNLNNGFIPHL